MAVALGLGGVAGGTALGSEDHVELIQAQAEIAEELRLDVGIQLFDPGLAEDHEEAQQEEEEGIYGDIRKSEARFIPYQLKKTLTASGQWGAVSVVPSGAQALDVNVSGSIVLSTGRALVVDLRVVDSTGRAWRDRRYKQLADEFAYDSDALERLDPLQSLYNQIANDLLESREKLGVDELRSLREVSQLRFAVDLAPTAYADYLSLSRRGRYRIERLPAEADPMIERIARIRERDDLFVDTLNEHYADFYDRMASPYGEWRRISYEEEMDLRAIRKEARMQKILGGLLLFGAVVGDGSSTAARVARDAAAVGGALVLKEGIDKGKQAKIHVDALNELAASFDTEVAPLLVEVEGQTLRLQGSAETQYAEWRRMLAEILATEAALPVDPDAAIPTGDAGAAGP